MTLHREPSAFPRAADPGSSAYRGDDQCENLTVGLVVLDNSPRYMQGSLWDSQGPCRDPSDMCLRTRDALVFRGGG